MLGSPRFWLNAGKSANPNLEKLLFGLSIYGVPIAIAIVSFIALSSWDSSSPSADPAQLEFRSFEQSAAALEPSQARVRLQAEKSSLYRDTNRSEAPFWVSFTTNPVGS